MSDRVAKLDNKALQWGLMAGLGIAFLMASSISAKAKIKCEGRFQVIKSQGKISTPYCEDNYLAAIARSTYGRKVGNRELRQNPGLKARICRQIGHDSRLIEICSDHRIDGGRDGGFR